MPMTITEALAEIKTIGARIQKKREFAGTLLWRMEAMRDPHQADGGSVSVLDREWQSIADLETRIVALRRAIRRANEATVILINGQSRSIADWITWRREVAPGQKETLGRIRQTLNQMRNDARQKNLSVGESAGDVIINFSETALAQRIERLEDTLGTLDGQLSLKNATILVNEEE